MHRTLTQLLAYLEQAWPEAPHQWGDWVILPMHDGQNNRLYRATGPGGDLAVKWTLRDQRDRAGREYAALQLLAQSAPGLAPRAVALERDRFHLPVVVQTWLDGEPLIGPPEQDDDWRALVTHYAAIHTVTPAHATAPLADAVLTAASVVEGQALVARHAALLPDDAWPSELRRLLERFMTWSPPPWPAPRRTLCRTDANWRNLLRCSTTWASVDWENSGWGDPAFEIAELMTHPAYDVVPQSRWAWVVATYAACVDDLLVERRIRAYEVIMQVWWAVRWARTLYEVPRGLDQRLVERSPSWQGEAEHTCARALARAEKSLDAAQR